MRNYVARKLTSLGRKLSPEKQSLTALIPELGADDMTLIEAAKGISMTPAVAQWEFIQAMRYVEARKIPGDIVECGVWRGGNLVIAGLLKKRLGFNRSIWAYDTFAGMTAPSSEDYKPTGQVDATHRFNELSKSDYNEWCLASLDEVVDNYRQRVGTDDLKTVRGPVQETLRHPENIPENIAVLRLDTDFYDSTKMELEVLYPRLAEGGVLIIDDYGEWAGARKAVDEFFEGRHVWLQYVTHTVRLMIKR